MRLLFNNWHYKLFSLLLALVFSLYIYYFGNYQVQATVSVPLVVQNLSSRLALADRLEPDVRLTVSGTPQEVNSFRRNLPRATLDLTALGNPGTYVLNPKLPELPNLKLTGFVPPVTVRLEGREERRLEVEILHEGTLPPGYVLSRESIKPEEVTVSGPESAVRRGEHAVALVALEGQVDDISQAVPLVVRDRDFAPLMLPGLTLIPSTVHYSAEVRPVADAKVVRVTPVLKGEPEVGYAVSEVTIQPSQVLFDKSFAARHSVSAIPTKEIDLTGRTRTFTVTVVLDYPFVPPPEAAKTVQVEVALQKVESEAANVLNLTVTLKNRQPGYDYLLRPSLIAVESEDLVGLSPEERATASAFVDVGAFGAGVYRVAPMVVLPGSVARMRMRPDTVELTVQPGSGEEGAAGSAGADTDEGKED